MRAKKPQPKETVKSKQALLKAKHRSKLLAAPRSSASDATKSTARQMQRRKSVASVQQATAEPGPARQLLRRKTNVAQPVKDSPESVDSDASASVKKSAAVDKVKKAKATTASTSTSESTPKKTKSRDSSGSTSRQIKSSDASGSTAKKPKSRDSSATSAKPVKTSEANGKKPKVNQPKVKKPKPAEATAKKPEATETNSQPDESKKPNEKKLNVKKPSESKKANDKKPKASKKGDNGATSPKPSVAATDKAKLVKKKPKANGSSAAKAAAAGKKVATNATDDKLLKSSKELKNLDIQIGGRSSVAAAREAFDSDDADHIVKASICEIVKTKARSSSAAIGNRSPLQSISPSISASPRPAAKAGKVEQATVSSVVDDKASPVKSAKSRIAETKETTMAGKKKAVNKTKGGQSKEVAAEKKRERQKEEKKSTAVGKNAKSAVVAVDDEAEAAAKPKQLKKKKKQSKASETSDSVDVSTATTDTVAKGVDEDIATADGSKSVIDAITETINEVVKQCHGDTTSAPSTPTSSPTPLPKNNLGKAAAAKRTAPKSIDSQSIDESHAAKATDVKPKQQKPKASLSEKKKVTKKVVPASVAKKKAGKLAPKKVTPKSMTSNEPMTSDKPSNDTDTPPPTKSDGDASLFAVDGNKSSSEPAAIEHKTAVTKPIDLVTKNVVHAIKKPTAKSKKLALAALEAKPKGSKIIKIDLKAKKRIRSQAAILKSMKTALIAASGGSAANAAMKIDGSTKSARTMNKTNLPDKLTKVRRKQKPTGHSESDDDDNMSLTELKAHLAQSELKQSTKSTSKDNGRPGDAVNSKAKTATKKDVSRPDAMEAGKKTTATERKEKADGVERKVAKDASNAVSGEGKKSDDVARVRPGDDSVERTIDDVVKTTTVTSRAMDLKVIDANAADVEDGISCTAKLEAKVRAEVSQKRSAEPVDVESEPKKRMASLNASAKVQCMYENSSRAPAELAVAKEVRGKSFCDVEKLDSSPITPLAKSREPEVSVESKEVKESGSVQDARDGLQEKLKDGREPEKAQKLSKPAKIEAASTSDESNDSEELPLRRKEQKSTESTKQKASTKQELLDSDDARGSGEPKEAESIAVEPSTSERLLRNVPGLRGEGLLWEMDGSSSDESHRNGKLQKAAKAKSKKKLAAAKKLLGQKEKAAKMLVKQVKKPSLKVLSKKKVQKPTENNEPSTSGSSTSIKKEPNRTDLKASKAQKRKVAKMSEVKPKEEMVSKRMASLNASAMMAVSYEVESEMDKCEERMYRIETQRTIVTTAPVSDAQAATSTITATVTSATASVTPGAGADGLPGAGGMVPKANVEPIEPKVYDVRSFLNDFQ